MSEYQLIELIFLAALAGYLIYRLYTILGQSGDHRKGESSRPGNVVPLRSGLSKMKEQVKVETNKPKNKALDEIYKAHPDFDEEHFLQGAEYAFKMIVEAFAKGDLGAIKDLLSSKVYETFKRAVEQRKSSGEMVSTDVIAIESLKILKSSVSHGAMKITVQIDSDQATTIRDKNGKDLNPDEEEIERATDQWTFRKKLETQGPNWTLHEIHDVSDEKANG